jgi:energy-coupling factor transporter ATP-binding protein EcfA2
MKTEKPITVAVVKISNILGIQQAEIRPGRVTLIEGKNAAGKTSLLEALKCAFVGGSDATLLRKGEARGEVVVLLSDGTEVIRTVTAEGSKSKIKHPDFGALSKPAAYLDKLRDTLSLNPVEFLTAKKDKRVELLLAAIPLRLQHADVADILDICSSPHDLDRHALQVLDNIEKDLYDQRTGINRSVKDKRTAAEEMKKALPPEAGEGINWSDQLETEQRAFDAFRESLAIKESAVTADIASRAARNDELMRGHVRTLETERDAEIQRIREEYQHKIDSAKSAANTVAGDLLSERDEKLAVIRKDVDEQYPIFQKRIAEAKANAETYIRAQSAREHVEQLESGAASLEQDAQTLSKALKDLETIKCALLDKLPIKDVEIRNGDVFVDGIPFDRVNESRRVRLAVEIAMLRTGNLPIMCVDGVEALDSSSLQALEQIAEESGIQLVMARVTDGPLEVRTIA